MRTAKIEPDLRLNVGPRNKLLMSSSDSPYKERLAMLGWSSLQTKRSYFSLLECYQTIHGLNGLSCNDYFEFNCYSKTRSKHSFNLRQPLARVKLPSNRIPVSCMDILEV